MATITQTKANAFGTNNVVFDAATAAGKVLFLYETKRDETAKAGDVVSFTWTALSADVSTDGTAGGDHGRWWYGTSTATDTYEVGSCRAYIYETDIDAATFVAATDVTLYESDNAGTSATLALGSVTAPTSSQLILYGATYDTAFTGSWPATAGAGWNIDYNSNTNASPPTGGSDQHPHTLVMRWNGSTTPLTGSATIGSAQPYAGVMIQTDAGPAVTCDSPVLFDVYSLGTATSPALTYLATLCDAFAKSFRVELDGTGSGKFSINRSSSDATAAILGDGDGDVRYIQVRILDIDPEPIFGFFIETGDFRLLDSDEQGGQTLTFSGHGSLAYLGFATMLSHSYITGGMDPYTGLWRLYLAGTGSKPGQMLGRIIEEAQDTDRPTVPLPLLTDTFDYTNDSNAAAWASSDATNEFAAQINESVLSVVGRLIGTGAITVQMSPTFVLSAYNSFGTDRSNATFAANKVRFVGGTNIAEGLTRQIRPSRVATHVNVYGEAESSFISSLADAATRVTREAGLSAFGSTATALEAIGDADLAERLLRSESLSVRIALGSDDATGLYLPGPSGTTAGKFWVGDTVTLHTGTGEFDYNNAAFPVAAINVIEGPNVALVTDLEVIVELGSTKIGDAEGGGSSNLLSSSPGGGSSAVPAHVHPGASVTVSDEGTPLAGGATTLDFVGAGVTVTGTTTTKTVTIPGASVDAELNIEGGQSVISAHGAMGATETFDPTAGNVHTGTASADVTFTLSAPVGTGASALELYITQDGTGGWDITWPGSVVWQGGSMPTIDTTAGTLTRYILESLDGGTTWYASVVGSGSGGTPATTVTDETTWGITPAVGTDTEYARQDHTHGSPASPTATTYYEVLLTEDGTEPITTEDGLDWLYVEVSI